MRSRSIHPFGARRGESVNATKTEIDRWVSIALTPTAWDAERANRARADFLLIDSEMALTFSGLALEDSNQENRLRRTQTARKAFDTIMRLRQDVALSDRDANKVNDNLERLRRELQELGERV